jgi:hypothetical protein
MPTQAFLCSALCQPASCTGITSTECTGCPTDWISSGTTCALDPTSGFSLITESPDLSASSTISLSPSTLDTYCGSYAFYGN